MTTIRVLTIVETVAEDGKVDYSAVGNLPVSDAASSLIILSRQAGINEGLEAGKGAKDDKKAEDGQDTT